MTIPRLRIGVTGGRGFLGEFLVDRLVVERHEVTVVDLAPPAEAAGSSAVTQVQADVRDFEAMVDALAGVEVIIHAAFAPPSSPRSTIESVNVGGAATVCRAAHEVGATRVIVVSSTIVSRPPPAHPVYRDTPAARLDAYRIARRDAEAIASRAGEGLEVAVARPKSFIGPGRVGGFALVFENIRRGGRVPVIGGGTNRYQLLDVRDLAAGLALLAGSHHEGLFEFGAARFETLATDLAQLLECAGTGARLRRLPRGISRVALRALELAGGSPLADWHHCAARGEDSVVSIQRAVQDLGWEPRMSNAEALIAAYRWYVETIELGRIPSSVHAVPTSHRLVSRIVSGRSDRAVAPYRRG